MALYSLADLPDGAHVLIDANIFVYHFSASPGFSDVPSRFLERVETGQVRGTTSSLVLIETLHRLMILEAVATLEVHPRDAVRYLKEHPGAVARLARHTTVPDTVLRIGVDVVTVELADVQRSHDIKRRYGLLTNDAILAATMERLRIHLLASNDADFDRVDGIAVYRLIRITDQPAVRCPRCQHDSPADAAFCEECGGRLETACPSCGTSNQPAAKFCRRCGQRLTSAALPESKLRSPNVPGHLAERILSSRAALEGERKPKPSRRPSATSAASAAR
jgi:predicted nucleic acid-binding protein